MPGLFSSKPTFKDTKHKAYKWKKAFILGLHLISVWFLIFYLPLSSFLPQDVMGFCFGLVSEVMLTSIKPFQAQAAVQKPEAPGLWSQGESRSGSLCELAVEPESASAGVVPCRRESSGQEASPKGSPAKGLCSMLQRTSSNLQGLPREW